VIDPGEWRQDLMEIVVRNGNISISKA